METIIGTALIVFVIALILISAEVVAYFDAKKVEEARAYRRAVREAVHIANS